MDTKPVSITVVGGYLGAGKTTLVNHLLRNGPRPEGPRPRLGVIVNDFGSINIDAELVVGVDGDLVQLSNGCICCTMQDDLVESLTRLLQVPEPPQHVIIEASGVSDPRAVAATLDHGPSRAIAAIDAVVVVIDVEHYLGLSRRERIVAGGQLAAADILVLNKVDLVEPVALDELEARLRRKAKGARILRAVRGQVAPELVLGVAAFDSARLEQLPPLEVHVHESVSRPADARGHEHHHHHDLEYWTWCFRSQRPLSSRRLRRAIDGLPDSVVRAKGTVQLASHPRHRAVMHVVGRRAELCIDEPWGDEDPKTGLVIIGSGEPVAPQDLEQAFRACEVEPGQSGPARAVMRWVRRVLPARDADRDGDRDHDGSSNP